MLNLNRFLNEIRTSIIYGKEFRKVNNTAYHTAKSVSIFIYPLLGNLEIDIFESGVIFLDSIRGGRRYDLVFMDIYMGDENGLDIVREMQKISPDTQVIFSTVSTDHAVEAFEVNAIGYLVKPYSEADIVKAFARATVRRENANDNVLIRSGNEIKMFRNSDVVTIESDRHYTNITVKDGTVSRFHTGFSEILPLFSGFIEINRGLAVNMSCIEMIKASSVTVCGGKSFNIARGKKDDVIARYTEFVLGSNNTDL
ncbi:MAG: LytR/AlgR family response regulator transcription factor [Oscillospiraceae bacterium]